MKIIIPVVDRHSLPKDIANLQDGLALLLRHRDWADLSEDARMELRKRVLTEQRDGIYGDGTAETVGAYQGENQIDRSGIVDERTAGQLNDELRQLGAFDEPQEPLAVNRVDGELVYPDGDPATGLTVVLCRRGFGGVDTEVVSGDAGDDPTFHLGFDGESIGLVLKVRRGDREVTISRVFDVVPTPPPAPATAERADLPVYVVPEALRPEEPDEYSSLTGALTEVVGDRAALANARQLDEQPDVTVLSRTTGWDARLIGLAAQTERLAADPDVTLRPEVLYGLLRAGLPWDKQALAAADGKVAGAVLKRAADAGLVALDADQLEAFGEEFARFSRSIQIATPMPGSQQNYRQMLGVSGIDEQEQAAFESVALTDGDDLWDRAREAGVSEPAVASLARQGKLAYLTGNSPALTGFLLGAAPGGPADLVEQDMATPGAWAPIVRSVALADATADELLPGLTSAADWAQARSSYAVSGDAGDLLDRGNLDDQQWAAARQAAATAAEARIAEVIPTRYGDGDRPVAQRLADYDTDLARKLRLAYPTHVLTYAVANDGTDPYALGEARTVTATAMAGAQRRGFRFGETPVVQFLQAHPDALTGVPEADRATARQQMERLYTTFQLSPGDQAQRVLMQHGLFSAQDVLARPARKFIDAFAGYFGSRKTPTLVYNRAQQIASTAYNLFAIAQVSTASPPMAALAPAAGRSSVLDETVLNRFPTLRSLFGSLDYCTCVHCRSILSPAAYFVDLLEFLDKSPSTGAVDPLTPLGHLLKLRPDLEHLLLDCDNTNTLMPYIDLVNEIMEHDLVLGDLTKMPALGVEGVSSADLTAEPQHVKAEAYEILAAAVYPMALPFDQPLESVRQHVAALGFSLADLLERFRDQAEPAEALLGDGTTTDWLAIATETLGLTPAEAELFADPDPLASWFRLYGYDQDPGGIPPELTRPETLAQRLGVSFAELASLLATRFVNPELTRVALVRALTLEPHELREFQGAGNAEVDTLVAGFSARTGLALDVLAAQLRSVDLAATLVIADTDAVGGFADAVVRLGDGTALGDPFPLLALNLFTRLWRRLDWPIDDLDQVLTVFADATATPFTAAGLANRPLLTALALLAQLERVRRRLEWPESARVPLTVLWTRAGTRGAGSPYARAFTRTLRTSDPVLDHPVEDYLDQAWLELLADRHSFAVDVRGVAEADSVDRAELPADPDLTLSYDAARQVQHIAYTGVLTEVAGDTLVAALTAASATPDWATAVGQLSDAGARFTRFAGHLPVLQAAFGLTATEIGHVLTGLDPAGLDTQLSVAGVSRLARVGLVAQALGQPVEDVLLLERLLGDPFPALAPTPVAELGAVAPFVATLTFASRARTWQDSPLTVDDIAYLLLHEQHGAADPTAPSGQRVHAPDFPDELQETILGVADAVRAARLACPDPAPDATVTEAELLRALGLLLPPDLPPQVVARLAGGADDDTRWSVFDDFLAQRTVRSEGEGGFLPAAEYDALFARHPTVTEASARRHRLMAALAPAVRTRQIRQALADLLAADAATRRGLVESLLTDDRLLTRPLPDGRTRPLLDRLTLLGTRGVEVTRYASPGRTDPAPLSRGTQPEATLTADQFGPARSATIEGWLQAPATGAYRFTIGLPTAGASADFRLDGAAQPVFARVAAADGDIIGLGPEEFAELKSGRLYRFTLQLENLQPGDLVLRVQSAALPLGPLSQLELTPPEVVDAAAAAAVLVAKALLLAERLDLDEAAIRALCTGPASVLRLSDLPASGAEAGALTAEAARSLGRALDGLIRYVSLRSSVPGTADALAAMVSALAEGHRKEAVAAFARATRRLPDRVLQADGLVDAADHLDRIAGWHEVLRWAESFSVDPVTVASWRAVAQRGASFSERFAIAADLRNAVRAHFPADNYRRLAEPVNNVLRSRQRDALVAYLLHAKHLDRLEELYERYLVDPGMEPIVQTSRIRLAIATVQLFIQRCLLNLQPDVPPEAIVNAEHWEWMKRYRVWEANRKIFLYPENWLEPEFRDDQSPLFGELESALFEGDVTAQVAEDAFAAYLQKLEVMARLDIVGMHIQQGDELSQNVVHVIGRTFASPYEYFYRCYTGVWSPWQPVNAPVEGNHVVPLWWRDKLHLFWITFLEKSLDRPVTRVGSVGKAVDTALGNKFTKVKVGIGVSSPPTYPPETGSDFGKLLDIATEGADTKQIDFRLNWSSLEGDHWGQTRSGPYEQMLRPSFSRDYQVEDLYPEVATFTDGQGGLQIRLTGRDGTRPGFTLAGPHAVPQVADHTVDPIMPYVSSGTTTRKATKYTRTGTLEVAFHERLTSVDGAAATDPLQRRTILAERRAHTLLPANNRLVIAPSKLETGGDAVVATQVTSGLPEIAALMQPFFYADAPPGNQTFYVEPTVTETTVEQWKKWVPPPRIRPPKGSGTGTGSPELHLHLPLVKQKAVSALRRPDPVGPVSAFHRLSTRAAVEPALQRDWLTEATVGVAFDGSVIDATGAAASHPALRVLGAAGLEADALADAAGPSLPVFDREG